MKTKRYILAFAFIFFFILIGTTPCRATEYEEESLPGEYGDFISNLPDYVIDALPDTALDDNKSSLYEAADELIGFTAAVKEDVDGWLLAAGFDYTSTVTVTEEWFDTREYDGLTLPAGSYRALKITLGEGRGRNWWCVMYPPMCLGIATDTGKVLPEYSDAEYRLIKSGKYSVKFKLLEIISDCFA